MKILIFPLFAVTFLTAALAGAGLFVGQNLDFALARYPGAERLGDGHANMRALSEGYYNQSQAYQTGDDVQRVWRWYAEELGAEPAAGMPVQGNCVELAANQRLLVWRAVRVSLCATSERTLVFVNEAVSLMP